MTATPFQGLNK